MDIKATVPAIKIANIMVEEVGSTFPSLRDAAQFVSGKLRAKDYAGAVRYAKSLAIEVHSAEQQFALLQLKAAVTKVDFESDELDPEGEAVRRFFVAEHLCRRTNARLRAWRRRLHRGIKPAQYMQQIHDMQRFILSVIGDEPPSFSTLQQYAAFGPGASRGVGGDATHFLRKILAQEWTVSPSCTELFVGMVLTFPGVYAMFCPQKNGVLCYDDEYVVAAVRARIAHLQEDKLCPVDKDAFTKRFIGTQPTGNTLVQLAIGGYIADRLRQFGCNTQDQTRNRRLAHQGSLGGFNPYVTLDLSMASDTVCFEICKLLLPPGWFSLLLAARIPCGVLPDGRTVRYEKFSAMGNGYTFPLECLLFLAAAHVASGRMPTTEYSVYGDDIICRQNDALVLIELLRFMGFRVNTDKSFVFGSFRESCGADYYDGVNVRPAYVKSARLGIQNIIGIHNRLATSQFVIIPRLMQRLRGLVHSRAPRRPLPVGSNIGGAFAVPPKDVRATDYYEDEMYQSRVYRSVRTTPVIDKEATACISGEPHLLTTVALAGGRSHDLDDENPSLQAVPCLAYRRRTKASVGWDAPRNPEERGIPPVDWGRWALSGMLDLAGS